MINFKNNYIFKLKAVSDSNIEEDIRPLLIDGEEIVGVYKAIRDHVIFTNKRAIVVDVQGITGRKKEYSTLPYSRIQAYSVETSGSFDMDSELELYFSGMGIVRFKFSRSSNMIELSRVIASYML